MEDLIKLQEKGHKVYLQSIKDKGMKVNDVLRYLADSYEKTKDENIKKQIVTHTKLTLVGLKEMRDENERLLTEFKDSIK